MSVTLQLRPPVSFIQAQAGAFRRALQDLEPLWERFVPILVETEYEQWETQGHGAWPPLAESTLLAYASSGKRGGGMMVDTGALKDSLTSPGAAEMGAMQLTFGTDVDYAHYHQEGGSIPGRPPKRQVIPDPYPVDARRKLEREMVSWINEVAARTWGRI